MGSSSQLRPGLSRYLQRGYLAPTEEILVETHASRWFFFPWPAFWIIVAAGADLSAAPLVNGTFPAVPYTTHLLTRLPRGIAHVDVLLLIFFLGLTIVSIWDLIFRWLAWAAETYAVTDERLIKQRGIVTHNLQEVPIGQVRDVTIYQKSLVARLFRYGTLQIHSLMDAPTTITRKAQGGAVTTPVEVAEGVAYLHPRLDGIDRHPGVEWWFGVPNPIRIQRAIERASEQLEGPRRTSAAYPWLRQPRV